MTEEKKRRILSPAERAEKLRAELAEAEKKAEAAAKKRSTELNEQRAKLVTKRDEIVAKIEAIDAELVELNGGTPADVDEPPPIEDDEV